MQYNKYEIHSVKDPLLPFIFHRAADISMRTLPNWHENLEILYCIQGCGCVKYNENVYTLHPGDLIVVNSDAMHCMQETGSMVYHCFILDRVFCESNGIPITSLYFQELIRDVRLSAAFLEICAAYDDYIRLQAFYCAAQVRAKAISFLCLLCEKYLLPQAASGKAGSSAATKSALLYIKQNYTRHITLEEIARHTGISKCYLAREFKKYTGKTVFDMVLRIRCKEARRLLQTGSSVSQAAFACGFESLSYFSKTFKRYYGIPPSQCLPKQKT